MQPDGPHWVAVWTRSRHEKAVRDVLAGQGMTVFLPLIRTQSRRTDRRAVVELPVFPGYLFAKTTLCQAPAIRKARGVVGIVGPTPEEYSVVPEQQVQAVRAMVESRLAVDPAPYVRVGSRVKVTQGPLRGIEGLLAEKRGGFRVVVNVELLGQSIAAEVSADQVEMV